jgi:multidrug efflux pump
MNVSAPFIGRPVATSLLTIAVVLLGILGYTNLPVSSLPDVDFPTIQVSAGFPGASPEIMETTVTVPLEHQLGMISGVTAMSSTSSFGLSTIVVQFSLNRAIDAAGQDVQSAINAAGGVLPRALPNPPTFSKMNPGDAPILILAITSPQIPLSRLNEIVDKRLVQRLSEVPGVGFVGVDGSQKPAVRVQVDPTKLAGLGLSLEDVRTAIAQANLRQPTGSLDGARQSFTLAINDRLPSAAEYLPLIIAYRNSAPVRLRDIASVVDGVENTDVGAWANGKPAIILNIRRQPGANIIETVDAVRGALSRLESTLPRGVQVSVVSDRTEGIRASIRDVQMALIITTLLVVLVMFVFLRTLRATIIPSIVLPVSIIATFGAMSLFEFNLDNLSLMALVVAAGFVVDDAIVMIENIVRHRELGLDPMKAAETGSRQVGFTIVSLTVSLVAVFIPLLLMPGLAGRLFREFSITLSIAVAISAVVSLTLTPMMCARILPRTTHSAKPGATNRLLAAYGRSLDVVLRHQAFMTIVFLATIALTVFLFLVIPKGFLPVQDTGLVQGITEAPPDVSFSTMAGRQQQIIEALRDDPSVGGITSTVGIAADTPSLNVGRLFIALKPHDLRHETLATTLARLSGKANAVAGITLTLQPVQDIAIDTQASAGQYRMVLQDSDADLLERWTPVLAQRLQSDPNFRDVSTDVRNGGLQLRIAIDRASASRLQIRMQAVADALYNAFGQRQISTIYDDTGQYRVVLEVTPESQIDPAALSRVYVGSLTGMQVPLSTLATIEHGTARLTGNRLDQFPAATISFNLAPGASLGDAVPAIDRAKHEIGLPESILTKFSGTAAEFRRSLANEPWLIAAALLVVYIVLGILYESFIHPLTILSTLPAAGVGALLSLLIFGHELSLISLIGILLLIGIVKKNGIMIVDFALDAERTEGLSAREAVHQASLQRFRPIMMTTMAALLGALPLAFAQGAGSELRQPLGIAIVGGLILSQALTLYTTPVIYLLFNRLQRRFASAASAEAPAP